MNEQIIDEIKRDAIHLFNSGELEPIDLLTFYRRVADLCAAYAQLKHQTRGVVFGDRFRAQLKQDMMDKGE